ncbi:hypothetical protein GOP47_0023031 [Adiantum capillus-veneris]|uniref:Uncharacterized protein n=1 Tax=Adiantum capillus-veneris TaxID=13818 RepID=A0A9D4U6Y7_ADICA|nr:hypothetical protein GOP47_0023031 [Adiantum capillus-veneris]
MAANASSSNLHDAASPSCRLPSRRALSVELAVHLHARVFASLEATPPLPEVVQDNNHTPQHEAVEAHSARGSASATLSRGKSWPFSPDALILRGAQRRGDGERCKCFGRVSTRDKKMDDTCQNEAMLQEETQADEDLRIDRIEDALVAIMKEFLGDRTTSQPSLRAVLLGAIETIKEPVNIYNVNVADVQGTRLEEQIFLLRKELSSLPCMNSESILCHLNQTPGLLLSVVTDSDCTHASPLNPALRENTSCIVYDLNEAQHLLLCPDAEHPTEGSAEINTGPPRLCYDRFALHVEDPIERSQIIACGKHSQQHFSFLREFRR